MTTNKPCWYCAPCRCVHPQNCACLGVLADVASGCPYCGRVGTEDEIKERAEYGHRMREQHTTTGDERHTHVPNLPTSPDAYPEALAAIAAVVEVRP